MPSSMSLRKFDTMPMVKKVSRKKMTRKAFSVPETALPVFCSSGDWRQMMRRMANVMM